MRFLGKYELLEQLTLGKVETFAAYPIGGGERLLIHVFALPALIKSAPTNRDLLGYMEALSPPVVGSLLDAGRYDDGSQGYVVTKFPRDAEALAKWIDAYKTSVKDKHDTTAEVVAGALWDQDHADQTQEIQMVEKPAGDFTRAFQASNLPKEAPRPTSVSSPQPLPSGRDLLRTEEFFAPRSDVTSKPGFETEQFMVGLGEGSRLGGPSQPVPLEAKLPSRPLHRESSDSDQGASTSVREPQVDSARPGEFTMFFNSPLAPQSGPSEPFVVEAPYAPIPSEPSKGEFTRLFGAESTPGRANQVPSEPLLEPASERDGFTGLFGKAASQSPEKAAPAPAAFPPVDADPSTSYVVSQNTDFPTAPPSQSVEPRPLASTEGGPVILGQSHDDKATRLFQAPQPDQPSPHAVAPPGESEYTRIISAKPKPAAPEKPTPPVQNGGEALKIPLPIAPPPVPSMHASAPHVPASPATPHVQWPQAPVPAAPKIPSMSVPATQSPKKGKVAGWTAYVPLIVILNLLLLAAIGLVLYFIFQH